MAKEQKQEAWRLEELAALAAEVVDVEGTSRRVRWVPGPRTLRYYTTCGLLDRPLFFEGRMAFYGLKHLAQIVVIKRLQARGLSLARIQEHLTGLPEEKLFTLAALPKPLPEPKKEAEDLDAVLNASPPASSRADSFWAQTPQAPPSSGPGRSSGPAPGPAAMAPSSRRIPVPGAAPQAALGAGYFIRLAPGVTVLIEGLPTGIGMDEIDAIVEASRPLKAKIDSLRSPAPVRSRPGGKAS